MVEVDEFGECKHGLEPDWCAECKRSDVPRGLRVTDRAESTAHQGRSFEARYDGTCFGCRNNIYPGDLIVAGEDGGYYHEECE